MQNTLYLPFKFTDLEVLNDLHVHGRLGQGLAKVEHVVLEID